MNEIHSAVIYFCRTVLLIAYCCVPCKRNVEDQSLWLQINFIKMIGNPASF